VGPGRRNTRDNSSHMVNNRWGAVHGEFREVSTVRRQRVYPIIGKQYLGITDAELRFTQAQPNVMNSHYAWRI
jgi:hypothetical protein